MEKNLLVDPRENKKQNLEERSNSSLYLARHITIDYYDCDIDILLDSDRLEKVLIKSAEAIWATIVSSNFNNFEPQGVSWVVVLSESHFTIHSWPEYGYAAVDMFACWDMQFEKWIELLTEVFKAKKVDLVTDLKRWLATNFEEDRFIWPWKNKLQQNVELVELKNNWKQDFKENNAWGIASSVDIYWCNPECIRDAELIKRYVRELCELIEMKRFWDTEVVHFWEDEKVAWFSMIQLIETSLISGHFANNTNVAYIDIFSCKYYDPAVVSEFTLDFFKWEYYKLNINMRDDK